MQVTYSEIQKIHGGAAFAVADAICKIHGGLSANDLKTMVSGIDISGCSDADQGKIKELLSKKSPDKDAEKTTKKEGN